MNQLLNKLKSLILPLKAEYLHAQAKISLSIFEDAMNQLRSINQQALAHTADHQAKIDESKKEIESASSLVAKNSKIIDKINEILN